MPGKVRAVHQQNVGIAVVVVVNERAAGPERLRQPLLPEGAVVVLEADSRALRDVAEPDRRTRLRRRHLRENGNHKKSAPQPRHQFVSGAACRLWREPPPPATDGSARDACGSDPTT